MKKILTLISFVLAGFTASAQDCDLPLGSVMNTGNNMIVMLTTPFINSLPISDPNSYIVALRPDGIVVGSAVVEKIKYSLDDNNKATKFTISSCLKFISEISNKLRYNWILLFCRIDLKKES